MRFKNRRNTLKRRERKVFCAKNAKDEFKSRSYRLMNEV